MAEEKIIDLPAIVTQLGNDIYEVSANGTASFKETRDNFISYIKSASQLVYVSDNGIDAAGRGGVNNPYATLDYAIAKITDNAASKIYHIECYSNVSINTLNIKPNILIDLQGNSLTVLTSVTLDSGWLGGGIMSLINANNVHLPATVNLDFSASSCPFALMNMSDLRLISSATTITVTSNPSGSVLLLAQDIFGSSNEFSWVINNCYGSIASGASMGITINHTSETAGGNFSVQNITEIGDILVSSSTASTFTFNHTSCEIIGTATYQAAGSGTVEVIAKSINYFNAPILDNGTSGGNIIFVPDVLSVQPVLMNGATFTPVTIGNSINANYSPINYTPIDPSVTGHLGGIDAALPGGSFAPKGNLRYFAVTGNDLTGDGSIGNPWATPQGANNNITDNAWENPYTVIAMDGNWPTEGDPIQLKPFVQFDYGNSNITFTNTITLDPSWSSLPERFRQAIKMERIDPLLYKDKGKFLLYWLQLCNLLKTRNTNFAYTGFTGGILNFQSVDINLDFSAISGLSALVNIGNYQVSSSSSAYQLNILGNPAGCNLFSNLTGINCVLNITQITIQDSYPYIANNFGIDLQLISTTNVQSAFAYLQNNVVVGPIDITDESNSNNSAAYIFTSPYLSGLNINYGQLSIDAASFISEPAGTTPTQYFLLSISNGLSLNYSPINFTNTDPAGSVQGGIQGIDNALGSLPLPPAYSPIGQQIWVNTLSGNDSLNGDISSPFASLGEAIRNALMRGASSSKIYVIHAIGDFSISGDFKIYPFINIEFHNTSTIRCTGHFTGDVSWTTTNNATAYIKGGTFVPTAGAVFNFGGATGNYIEFENCDWSQVATFSTTSSNTNTTSNVIRIKNTSNVISPAFPSSLFVGESVLEMVNIFTLCTPHVSATGLPGKAGASLILNHCNIYHVLVDSSGSSGANAILATDASTVLQNPPSIIGGYSQYNPNSGSYTQVPVFSSGASISQVNVTALSDGILQTSYAPVNFSPIGSSNYGDNTVTAMIAGLDAAINPSSSSSAPFPFAWDTGNSSNLTDVQFNSGFYMQIGNFVSANISLLVYPNNTNWTVAFTAPLVASGAFTSPYDVSLTGNISYYSAPGGAGSLIGNGTDQPGAIISSNSIAVPGFTTSFGFYIALNLSFSYQFQGFLAKKSNKIYKQINIVDGGDILKDNTVNKIAI